APLHGASFTDTSDDPYTAIAIGYRLPGVTDRDFAAGQILADILNSPRGDLYALQATGKVYQAQFQAETHPKLSIGIATAAIPIAANPQEALGWIKSIVDGYRKHGVPNDLVQS